MGQYANPGALVETSWLAAHLEDPGLRVVDVHIDPTPYEQGHIPGAVFWNGLTTLLRPDYRVNFDASAIEALLGQAGITNDSTVVVYSDHTALAPWVYWFLKTIGHDDVHVLNGGRAKWVAENRPLATEVPEVTPTSYTSRAPDPARRVLLDQVRKAVGDDGFVLVDVRAAEEYRGELFMLEPPQGTERAGHIPGATPRFYETS